MGLPPSLRGWPISTLAVGSIAAGIITLAGLSIGMFSIGGAAIGDNANGHIAIGHMARGIKVIVSDSQTGSFDGISAKEVEHLIQKGVFTSVEPDCQLADTVFSLITPDFTLTESETELFFRKICSKGRKCGRPRNKVKARQNERKGRKFSALALVKYNIEDICPLNLFH